MKHQSDLYFKQKFNERLEYESHQILREAQRIRHQHPTLSGPELVRLVYWGTSGTTNGNQTRKPIEGS